MGTILKITIGAGVIALLIIAVNVGINQNVALQTSLGHIDGVFTFIVGNIQNMSSIFSFVIDAIVMFSAVMVIESTLVIWKIFTFIAKMTHRNG